MVASNTSSWAAVGFFYICISQYNIYVCMYICIFYVYTHVRTYKYVYIYIHIYKRLWKCKQTHIHLSWSHRDLVLATKLGKVLYRATWSAVQTQSRQRRMFEIPHSFASEACGATVHDGLRSTGLDGKCPQTKHELRKLPSAEIQIAGVQEHT